MTISNSIRDSDAGIILIFWFEETKPHQWFRRDAAFDESVRARFGAHHAAAAAGDLDNWMESADTALARIIILDQFSRNIYRDEPLAFAQDDLALAAARDAVAKEFDQTVEPRKRAFFLMPFMHAEDANVQDESVQLFISRGCGEDNAKHARQHRDIVKRFGRFPHRNKVMVRTSTPEETQFLKDGGFNP